MPQGVDLLTADSMVGSAPTLPGDLVRVGTAHLPIEANYHKHPPHPGLGLTESPNAIAHTPHRT